MITNFKIKLFLSSIKLNKQLCLHSNNFTFRVMFLFLKYKFFGMYHWPAMEIICKYNNCYLPCLISSIKCFLLNTAGLFSVVTDLHGPCLKAVNARTVRAYSLQNSLPSSALCWTLPSNHMLYKYSLLKSLESSEYHTPNS